MNKTGECVCVCHYHKNCGLVHPDHLKKLEESLQEVFQIAKDMEATANLWDTNKYAKAVVVFEWSQKLKKLAKVNKKYGYFDEKASSKT